MVMKYGVTSEAEKGQTRDIPGWSRETKQKNESLHCDSFHGCWIVPSPTTRWILCSSSWGIVTLGFFGVQRRAHGEAYCSKPRFEMRGCCLVFSSTGILGSLTNYFYWGWWNASHWDRITASVLRPGQTCTWRSDEEMKNRKSKTQVTKRNATRNWLGKKAAWLLAL